MSERRAFSKVLIPVDGSEHSLKAVEAALRRYRNAKRMSLDLLNVQAPVDSGHARMFVSEDELQCYYQAEGSEALKAAVQFLESGAVPHTCHLVIGHVAETIVRFAREKGYHEIVMGTHGRSALTHLLLGSIAFDVLRTAQQPVTLVK